MRANVPVVYNIQRQPSDLTYIYMYVSSVHSVDCYTSSGDGIHKKKDVVDQ